MIWLVDKFILNIKNNFLYPIVFGHRMQQKIMAVKKAKKVAKKKVAKKVAKKKVAKKAAKKKTAKRK